METILAPDKTLGPAQVHRGLDVWHRMQAMWRQGTPGESKSRPALRAINQHLSAHWYRYTPKLCFSAPFGLAFDNLLIPLTDADIEPIFKHMTALESDRIWVVSRSRRSSKKLTAQLKEAAQILIDQDQFVRQALGIDHPRFLTVGINMQTRRQPSAAHHNLVLIESHYRGLGADFAMWDIKGDGTHELVHVYRDDWLKDRELYKALPPRVWTKSIADEIKHLQNPADNSDPLKLAYAKQSLEGFLSYVVASSAEAEALQAELARVSYNLNAIPQIKDAILRAKRDWRAYEAKMKWTYIYDEGLATDIERQAVGYSGSYYLNLAQSRLRKSGSAVNLFDTTWDDLPRLIATAAPRVARYHLMPIVLSMWRERLGLSWSDMATAIDSLGYPAGDQGLTALTTKVGLSSGQLSKEWQKLLKHAP